MSNTKIVMSEEALKIARENSKKQAPSVEQKNMIEQSNQDIEDMKEKNSKYLPSQFAMGETRVLDFLKNGKQGERLSRTYEQTGEMRTRATYVVRDLTSKFPDSEKEWRPIDRLAKKLNAKLDMGYNVLVVTQTAVGLKPDCDVDKYEDDQ